MLSYSTGVGRLFSGVRGPAMCRTWGEPWDGVGDEGDRAVVRQWYASWGPAVARVWMCVYL